MMQADPSGASAGNKGAVRKRSPYPAGTLKLHRTLAPIAVLFALCWLGTGLLHPFMVKMGRKPVNPVYLSEPLPAGTPLLSPAKAIETLGWKAVNDARLFSLEGKPVWRLRRDGPTSGVAYLDATTGEFLPNAARKHASLLSAHFLGRPESDIATVTVLTAYDNAYPSVNRHLPVSAVRLRGPDRITNYVSLDRDQSVAIGDANRTNLQSVFRTLHTWAPLDGLPGVRLAVMMTGLLAVFGTVLLGLWAFFRMPLSGQRPILRTVHRSLGALMAVPVLLWLSSGSFHLLLKATGPSMNGPDRPSFARTDLLADPVRAVKTIAPEAQIRDVRLTAQPIPVWQVRLAAPAVIGDFGVTEILFLDGKTGAPVPGAHLVYDVLERAGLASKIEINSDPQTAYDKDYGPFLKRLPVWKVKVPGGAYWVDVMENTIAQRHSGLTGLENWTFDNLHKWQWLDRFVGRKIRDNVVLLVASVSLMLVLSGLNLTMGRMIRSFPLRLR